MSALPLVDGSLLVRSSATDESAWARLLEAVRTETEDGFRAYVEVVDDPEWFGKGHDEIRASLRETDALVLFIAGATDADGVFRGVAR